MAELADPPVIPVAITHIWIAFFELHRGRQNGMSLNPLSWHDIAAYQALTGCRFERWELDVLLLLDDVFLDVMQNEQMEVKEGF